MASPKSTTEIEIALLPTRSKFLPINIKRREDLCWVSLSKILAASPKEIVAQFNRFYEVCYEITSIEVLNDYGYDDVIPIDAENLYLFKPQL